MSAANPFSVSTMDQKAREPSMEEILASIRRIIADDQSLPRHTSVSEPTSYASPQHFESRPAVSEPSVEPAVDPLHEAEDAGFRDETIGLDEHMAQIDDGYDPMDKSHEIDDPRYRYGSITPQYPTPGGGAAHERPYSAASPHQDGARPTLRPVPPIPEDESFHEADEPASQMRGGYESPESLPPMSARPDVLRPSHAEPAASRSSYEMPLEHEERSEDSPGLFSSATDTAVASAFNMLAATRLADNSEELKSMVREMVRPLLRSWLDDNLPSMVERMVRAEIERVARGGR